MLAFCHHPLKDLHYPSVELLHQIFLRKGVAGTSSFTPYTAFTLGSESFGQFATGFSGAYESLTYSVGLISCTGLDSWMGSFCFEMFS